MVKILHILNRIKLNRNIYSVFLINIQHFASKKIMLTDCNNYIKFDTN